MATKKGAKQKSDRPREDIEKMEDQLDEEELEHLYTWVDEIPLSRPKRNISRDFSDGVMVVELLKHLAPNKINVCPIPAANSFKQKKDNWLQLNRKVFAKMNFELAEDVINDLANCKPGMIEKVLLMLQVKIKRAEWARKQSEKPEADQHHSMSPGRKDGKVIKVGMDDTKGSRFMKTKQIDEYGHYVTHHYLDNKGWNSGNQRTPTKVTAAPVAGGVPKRRVGPIVESDLVPRYLIEEKEQDVLSRDESIQILQEKVKKMEHLMQLKDIRIVELTNQMEQHNVTQAYPHHHHQGAHYATTPPPRHHAVTPPPRHHAVTPPPRHHHLPLQHDVMSSYHHTSRPTGRARYEQIEYSLRKV